MNAQWVLDPVTGERLYPKAWKRGLVAEMETPHILRIHSDASGGLWRYDLAEGRMLEQRGEFTGLEPEIACSMLANAGAEYRGRPSPDWRRGQTPDEIHIYRYDSRKQGSEYNRRRAAELLEEPKEKPAGDTAGK